MGPTCYGLLISALNVCLMRVVVCERGNFTRFDMFEILDTIDYRILEILAIPKPTVEVRVRPLNAVLLINLLKQYLHILSQTKYMMEKRDRDTLALYDKLVSQNGPLFLQVNFDVMALRANHVWSETKMGLVHRLFSKVARKWAEFRMTDVHHMNMTWIHPFSLLNF